MKHGINCGGWGRAGRIDEFGRIPDRYPVKELKDGRKDGRSLDRPGGLETAAPWEELNLFAQRTLQNVKDSNGTIIIYFDKLRGGSAQTVKFCTEQKRPHILIDAAKMSAEGAANLILDLVREHKIDILNVAGPRQSEWPGGYDSAFRALDLFLTRSARPSLDRGARRSKRG